MRVIVEYILALSKIIPFCEISQMYRLDTQPEIQRKRFHI